MKKIIVNNVKENLLKMFMAFLLLLTIAGISIKIPTVLERFIDEALIGDSGYGIRFVALYIFLVITKKVLTVSHKYVNESVNWELFNKIRIDILEKLLSFDEVFFYTHSYGELAEYSERDINIMSSYYSNKFFETILNIVILVGIILSIFIKNIFIGIVFTGYILVSLVFLYKKIGRDSNVLKEYISVNTETLGKYSEWVFAHKDINLIRNGIDYIKQKFEEQNKKLEEKTLLSQRYLYKIWTFTLFISSAANILFLIMAGYLYWKRYLSLGTVYLVYSYSVMLKEPIENFQSELQAFLQAKAAYCRLDSLISYEPEISNGMVDIDANIEIVKIEHLYYRYRDTEEWVLEDVNMAIKDAGIIGIAGESGAGKSTLCKLLVKAFKPSKGNIYINGVDIERFEVNKYRKCVSYFSTDSQLLNTTIKDNLVLYDDHISDEEVIKVLNLYGINNYWQGLDKKFVNQRVQDAKLSDGQKQLINIIRVLFIESKILILDETSSKLDPEVRKCMLNIVDKLRHDKIIILISHNMNDLACCDKIYSFSKGRLME